MYPTLPHYIIFLQRLRHHPHLVHQRGCGIPPSHYTILSASLKGGDNIFIHCDMELQTVEVGRPFLLGTWLRHPISLYYNMSFFQKGSPTPFLRMWLWHPHLLLLYKDGHLFQGCGRGTLISMHYTMCFLYGGGGGIPISFKEVA